MKTKKILMLMAAMLLSCTSAFAQNGNNTPAKGDVNEDGNAISFLEEKDLLTISDYVIYKDASLERSK